MDARKSAGTGQPVAVNSPFNKIGEFRYKKGEVKEGTSPAIQTF